uniref:Putative DNA polymerase n=1 Tax=viral metagenome TaxID=1070528 RepID=A0A6H1ZB32_9ZZZZ
MLAELQTIMPCAKKVVSQKTTMPILTYLAIANGKIRATNCEESIAIPVDSDIACTIPFDVIEKILRTKPKTLDIQTGSDFKVLINYDGKTVNLVGRDVQDFPSDPDIDFKRVGMWSTDIIKMMYRQLDFVSKDELRPALLGVFIVQDTDMTTCATNGNFLKAFKNVKCHSDIKYECILSRKAAILLNLNKESVEVFYKNTESPKLKFVLENGISIVSRIIDEHFPDWESVIPKEFQFEFTTDRKQLLNNVKEAQVFSNQTTFQASVQIETDKIHLNTSDAEKQMEWNADLESTLCLNMRLPTDIVGSYPNPIGFNLKYMEIVLKSLESGRIRMKGKSERNALLFEEVAGFNLIALGEQITLLMPIRLKE